MRLLKLSSLAALAIMLMMLIVSGIVYATEEDYPPELPNQVVRAKVLEVIDNPTLREQYGHYVADVQTVVVQILEGDFKGEVLTLDHVLSGNMAYDFYLDPGDRVLLWIETMDGELINAYVSEFLRDTYLFYLIGFFILALIVVGGLQGVKTAITLIITGIFIIFVMLPMILKGHSPIAVAVLVTSAIVAITLVIISGLNRKTLAAIIGTIGGVVVAGIIALLMSYLTKLTGLSNEEAQMLMFIPQGIQFDFRGLLFAGMIIGAMGAVLDVGISVASAMDEVKRANPNIATNKLVQSGLNVGKDIMGTMSNTLILAYTGASMPLLLVFMAYDTPLARIVNLDLMATEIVRALAGSIGLIFAIPITAIAAGILYKNKK